MKGKKLQTEERHKGLQHQGTARPAERSTARHSPRRVLRQLCREKGVILPRHARRGPERERGRERGRGHALRGAGQSSHVLGAGQPPLASPPWDGRTPHGCTHTMGAHACGRKRGCPEGVPVRGRACRCPLAAPGSECTVPPACVGHQRVQAARAAQPRASCCPHTAPMVPGLCQVPHCGGRSVEPRQAHRGDRNGLCAWSSPWRRQSWTPLGDFLVGFLSLCWPSTERSWLQGSRTAQASPRDRHAAHTVAAGDKGENSRDGCKKGKKKKPT